MSKEVYLKKTHSPNPLPTGASFYSGDVDRRRLSDTLSRLIDIMDIAMWELDRNYKVVGCNEKAKTLFGDDLSGNCCHCITGKSDSVCENCPAAIVFKGEPKGRSEQKKVDASGNTIFVDHFATPITDDHGRLTGAFVFSVDITAHKLIKEEISRHRDHLEVIVQERTQALEDKKARHQDLYEASKKQEALYRSFIESCADAIAIYDLEGRITYLNPSFIETFGWRLDELDAPNASFIPQAEKAAIDEKIRQVAECGEQQKCFRTKWWAKDGRLLDVDISISRYVDHRDRPAGVLLALRDRTRSMVLEKRLLQRQKLESISTLAGGVAHDFNNILMGIQGRVSLIMSETGSHSPQYEHIESINDYIENATDLTSKLLGFARGGKYDVKTTNLNEMIDKSLKMFGRTRNEIKIHKKYDTDLWSVDVDMQQIQQVLLNLYVNAVQAMPKGGNLYLHTENVVIDEDHPRPFHVNIGRYVKISVTDTGVGMDQSTMQKVFDPFFTTKTMGRGTGLGLASAYGIIKNHRGIITVYSEIGHGATFNIYLPATLENPNEKNKKRSKILFGKETVLLLDDEKMVLDVGRPMLEKLGYTVFVAASGKEALEMYKSSLTDIQLVIIDMIMPEMSGGDVYDALKKINPDVKVLLSSGYSINGEAEKILARGCNGFIQKPFGLSILSQKIRMILDEI